MNKKAIISLVIVIAVVAVGIGGYFLLSKNDNTKEKDNTSVNENNNENGTKLSSDGKVLVVYYSATGSTEKVAKELSKNLNADLFEIVPETEYTSADLDWTDNDSRVAKEHNDKSLRDVKLKNTKVDNWENYDTVLIGYPIWWGESAWPVNTFVKANNFNGKTVIPFCTSASSGLGQSGTLLKETAGTGDWKEGHRFSSGASASDIKTWTESLK